VVNDGDVREVLRADQSRDGALARRGGPADERAVHRLLGGRPAVYVPWTFRHEPTWELLAPLDPIGVDCRDDTEAYIRHFIRRWNAREPFVNVEHDMLVSVAQVLDLWACPEPWCAHGYAGGPGRFPWFGSVRFRPAFMDRFPSVWTELYDWAHSTPVSHPDYWRLVGEVPMRTTPPGIAKLQEWLPLWRSLDSWLVHKAEREGVKCHRHYPDVTNCRPADHPATIMGEWNGEVRG